MEWSGRWPLLEGETNEPVWEAEGQAVNCAAASAGVFTFPELRLCFYSRVESVNHLCMSHRGLASVDVPSSLGYGRHLSRIFIYTQGPKCTRCEALGEGTQRAAFPHLHREGAVASSFQGELE